ncbi:hypothetical protein LTR84_012895 [Exophiala bonariae]|uniref:Zn(2)-C6 fungal-type domain-containing protein n=1 Tax=Exophiala bonariae TaxID=1690606 RepID=A0AAV9ND54_9EURO|nr:hypothetical protein LTR84_012895 [Exophiala bonariae]
MSTKQSPLEVSIQVTDIRAKANSSRDAIAKRKYAPKSRGGCATCRNRHVRCDQQRPRCVSCQRSSRQCFYSDERDQSHQANLRLVLWEPAEPILSQSQMSLIPGQTPTEARALDYFREIVAPNLAGTYDPTFWNRVVVQVSHNASSLRHAVVALASHWERVVEPSSRKRNTPAQDCDNFALQQYSKAVTGIRKSLETAASPSKEELLVSTLLFYCIELYQSHLDSALRQLSCGIQLFCEWSNSKDPESSSDHLLGRDEFTRLAGHIFRRLLVQCMIFPMRSIVQEPVSIPQYTPITPDMPENFSSSDEARDYYNFCLSAMCYHSKMSETMLTPEERAMENHMQQYQPFMKTVSYFEKWQQAFKTFQRTSVVNVAGEPDHRCLVMDIHNHALQVMIPSFSFKTEVEYDNYTHLFAHIIDTATSLLTLTAQLRSKTRNLRPHFPKFDIGLIPPMFLTALRCRDPVIRRKAIALLRKGPRQEGVWNSDMVAAVAERVVAIEESGLSMPSERCEDVPASSRVKITEALMHTSTRHVAVVLERDVMVHDYRDRLMYEMISY